MKKILLLSVAAMVTFAGFANTRYQRSSLSTFKQINTAGHASTQSIKPQLMAKAAMQVPENALEVPVKHSLGKNEPDNIKLYTTIDANNDGNTWKVGGMTTYSVCLTSAATVIDGSDDWMVTPPIHLLPGTTYKFSYEEGCATTSSKEGKLEVKFGKEPTVEGMTNVIFSDPNHILKSTTFTQNSKKFTVSEEGYYYFGFHAYSPKGSNAKVCNLSITNAADDVTPPAAGTLTYALAPKGALKATLTYTPPTTDQEGNPLTEISKATVKVNYDLYGDTLRNITPGTPVTFDVDMKTGFNSIEIVSYAKDVAGLPTKLSNIYCGADNPLPPANPKISVSDDLTKVTVSWDAVGEIGENGGYVDPSKVVYYIFDAFGSYYDPALAETTKTSYTFDYSDWKQQDFVAYQITAGVDEYYYSLNATTDIATAGPAAKTPFTESFTNANISQDWISDPFNTKNGWYYSPVTDTDIQTNADDEEAAPQYLTSQDGDNGFFYAMPIDKDAIFGIQSGNIDLTGTTNPVFEFWAQGKGSDIEMLVSTDCATFNVVKTIKFKETPTSDWTLYRASLKDYKTTNHVRVGLRLIATDNDDEHSWSIPFDNISVRDLADTDLRLFYPNVSSDIKAGDDLLLSARVQNLGTTTCADATVQYTVNGTVVGTTAIQQLAPNTIQPVTFSYPTNMASPSSLNVEISVKCPGDAVATNNTATATIGVSFPQYPTVSNLQGTVENNKVTLTWDAPNIADAQQPVLTTEDFENPHYTPLTISNFGDWTLYDGDGQKTYNILRETSNPYQTQPQAFQLFNPILAGVPEDYLVDAQPHSGNQFLVAWSAAEAANDNWLISPRLSEEEQTISFFAKSFSISWPESFEVLYSTTDKDVDSFIKIDNVVNYPESGEVPEDWTEFKATLPQGAKYFAIHHNSYDSGALYIDDITYVAAPSIPDDIAINGYNLYRDGIKVNDELITATTTLDNPLATVTTEGNYTFHYQVSPVYNYGESKASDAVEVSMEKSSVQAINADNDADAIYYNLQGIKQKGNNLPAGIYIRSCGGKSEKIVIRK